MAPRKPKSANAPQTTNITKKVAPKIRVKRPEKIHVPKQLLAGPSEQAEDLSELQQVGQANQVSHLDQLEQPEQAQDLDLVEELEKPKQSKKTKVRAVRGAHRDWSQYTENPPSKSALARNGRKVGRVLIPWTRLRMAEKLLLHIEYETELHGMRIPWDNVAHRLSPGSSGTAITQHLARMRKQLIAEGHMVPPIAQKPGGPAQEPGTTRGFIRMYPDSIDNLVTRKVSWTEPLDDLTKPLGNAVYALQNANTDEHDEEEVDEEDLVEYELRGRRSLSTRSHGPRRSGHSARPLRTRERVTKLETQDDTLVQDSATDGDDESEDSGVHNSASRTARVQPYSTSRRMDHKSVGRRRPARGQPMPNRTVMPPGHYYAGPATPQRRLPNGYAMPNSGQRQVVKGYGYPMTAPEDRGAQHNFAANEAPQGINAQPSTPRGYGNHAAFTTVESSPFDFDMEGATPATYRAYVDHLLTYNSPTTLINAGHRIPVGSSPPNARNMPGNFSMPGISFMQNSPSVPGGATTHGRSMTPAKGSMAGNDFVSNDSNVPSSATVHSYALTPGNVSIVGDIFAASSASMVGDPFTSNGPAMTGDNNAPGYTLTPGVAAMEVNLMSTAYSSTPGRVSARGSTPMTGNEMPHDQGIASPVSVPGSAFLSEITRFNKYHALGSGRMNGNGSMNGSQAMADNEQMSVDAYSQLLMADDAQGNAHGNAHDNAHDEAHNQHFDAPAPLPFEDSASKIDRATERE